MNIFEAAKTGRPFKRPNFINFLSCPWSTVIFCSEDILADDWEIEPVKVTITYEDLRRIFYARARLHVGAEPPIYTTLIEEFDAIAHDLGLL